METREIRKVLVANRGEIALRVIRSLREMDIASVAVFSEVDRMELHVRSADEAYLLGPAPPGESYLRIDRLVEVAKDSGCDAVHPGYGFLAENESFAQAVEDAGLVFIGPTPHSIALAGDKVAARRSMMSSGVPVIPGSVGPSKSFAEVKTAVQRTGFPVALKAVGGGGGKGIRVVREEKNLASAFERASSEAGSAFGNPTMYVEKYLEAPRHIEIQVFADQHGNCVHLGERECSLQRRHQKLLEESPSPIVDADMRARMGAAAVAAARAVDYRGAGTVEFLVDRDRNFYFLEMNTRIQVEHPVTEMLYGVDLVALQIRVAEGKPLPFAQEDLEPSGHAIEIRLTAENPYANFMPESGTVSAVRLPHGPGIRVDASVYPGQEVTLFYDPMIGKIIAHGRDREEARRRLIRALMELRLVGISTCAPLMLAVLHDERYIRGDTDTAMLEAFVNEPGWQEPGTFSGVPADVAAVITAVLNAHANKGAGRAVLGGEDGGRARGPSPWVLAARKGLGR